MHTLNTKKMNLFILLAFALLALLNFSPSTTNQDIENLANQFDLKLVTAALEQGYCDNRTNPKISHNLCSEYFQLISNIYYESENKLQLITKLGLQDASYYIDQLASGSIDAKSEQEKTFLKQYNPWLLQVSNIHILHNLLSPMNFNVISLLKSLFLSNSYSSYLLQLVVLFLSLFYLKRFYSLPIVAGAIFSVLILSNIITCLYFTRPSSYLVGANTLSIVGLSFILSTCWKHKLSKLHPSFLISPFNVIPLAVLILILILYSIFMSLMQSSQFQSTALLPTIFLGTIGGLFLQYFPATKTDSKKDWDKLLSIHFDELVLHQNFADKMLELNIQGIMTDSQRQQSIQYLPRYFQLLELRQNSELFLKELAKHSAYWQIEELCLHVSLPWLNRILQSQQLDTQNELFLKIDGHLKKNNFQAILLSPQIKASRSRRLMAFFIDLILYSIALGLVKSYVDPLLYSFFSMQQTLLHQLPNQNLQNAAEYVAKILTLSLVVIPPLLYWHATFGKKILSIKIAHQKNGHKLYWWQLIGREFLGKPLSSVFLLLGYMMILLPGRKTLHDHLFATKVVIDYND